MAVAPDAAVTEATSAKVSVCIANFNGALMLRDCLDSVLRQEGNIPTEIIVHDDASTDASLSVVGEYTSVRLLQSRENVGFCVANNRMVAASTGRYILLLNNDAALFPDALSRLLEAAEASQQEQILSLPQYDWSSGQKVDQGCLLDPFFTPVPNLDSARREVAYVIGACLWISRSGWEALGGFPEWMESIAEDLYLCCQARLAGFAVRALTTSGYRHRQGVSFGGNRAVNGRLRSNCRRRYLSERNRLVTMLACSPAWLRWPWWLLIVSGLAVEALALMAMQRSLDPLRRIYWPATRDSLRLQKTARSTVGYRTGHRRIGTAQFRGCFVLIPRKLTLLLRHGIPTIEK